MQMHVDKENVLVPIRRNNISSNTSPPLTDVSSHNATETTSTAMDKVIPLTMQLPSLYEAAEAAEWVDRVEIVTKQDHLEHINMARDFVLHIIDVVSESSAIVPASSRRHGKTPEQHQQQKKLRFRRPSNSNSKGDDEKDISAAVETSTAAAAAAAAADTDDDEDDELFFSPTAIGHGMTASSDGEWDFDAFELAVDKASSRSSVANTVPAPRNVRPSVYVKFDPLADHDDDGMTSKGKGGGGGHKAGSLNQRFGSTSRDLNPIMGSPIIFSEEDEAEDDLTKDPSLISGSNATTLLFNLESPVKNTVDNPTIISTLQEAKVNPVERDIPVDAKIPLSSAPSTPHVTATTTVADIPPSPLAFSTCTPAHTPARIPAPSVTPAERQTEYLQSRPAQTLMDMAILPPSPLSQLKYSEREMSECRNSELAAKEEAAILHMECQQLQSELNSESSKHASLQAVMAEYDATIGKVIEDSERAKITHAEDMARVASEKGQALADLQSVESAFSDLHRRFEKLKGLIDGYRQNEETLKTSLTNSQNAIENSEKRYQTLTVHAEEKIKEANAEIERVKNANKKESSMLLAKLKRETVTREGLEKRILTLESENKELMAICDDLVAANEKI